MPMRDTCLSIETAERRNAETPPAISASGRKCCCAPDCAAHREGASLSVTAGAHRCRLSSRRPPRAQINATLYEKLNFNFILDIVPVAGIARGPFVMEVNPSVPVKTVPELIVYAKANPGKINMASAG